MNLTRVSGLLRKLTGSGDVTPEQHFTRIYRKNLFGGKESRSGPGSSLEQTVRIRRELPDLLDKYGIKSFLDAPCGDCNWISKLDWSAIRYVGADVVEQLVVDNRTRFHGRGFEFIVADLCADPLPRVDLIFCRDCWVHLDYLKIRSSLLNFKRSGASYLLTTTFLEREENCDLGDLMWRPINLQRMPFSWAQPLEVLIEDCSENGGIYADKALGLWRLADLV